MKKILATQWFPEVAREAVPADEFELICPPADKPLTAPEDLKAALGGVQAIFGITTRITADIIDAGKDLEVVANFGVGYDNIDYVHAGKKGIPVVNTPKTVTQATAELTIGLMLAVTRGIVDTDKEIRRIGTVVNIPFPENRTSMYGKTLGIIGFGRIGKEVARKARGLGLSVNYFDAVKASPEVEAELEATLLPVEEILKTSDFVTLHCPYTPENHHLINAKSFDLMKPTAYFFNAARGPLVDEQALVDALRAKKIRGAGIDVYEEEPAIHRDLLCFDNVVLTPHIGTGAFDIRIDMAKEALTGICECLRGKRPYNVVNYEYFPK